MFYNMGRRAVQSSLRPLERLSKSGVCRPGPDFTRLQYELKQRRSAFGETTENT
jgi:hypothetical protein